ncbi:MAG: ATP-binding protein [Salibacteraceae bacterium]
MKPAPHSLVIVLLLLMQSLIVSANQSITIQDSLKKVLQGTLPDTTRADVMAELAYEQLYSDPELAKKSILRVLRFARQKDLEDKYRRIEALMGIYYMDRSQHDSALYYHHRVVEYLVSVNDKEHLPRTYHNIAQVYQQRNSFPQALEYYQKAKALTDEFGTPRDRGNSVNNLASYHIEYGNYLMDVESDSVAFVNQYQASIPYLNQAMELYQEAGYDRGIAFVLGNLALVKNKIGNRQEALAHLMEASDYFEKSGNKLYVAIAYNSIATIYVELDSLEKAEAYALKTLEVGREIESKIDQRNAFGRLVEIYEHKGDYKTAMEYSHQYSDLVSQIMNEENRLELNTLEQKFKVAEKEQENIQLKHQEALKSLEISEKNRWLTLLVGGLIVLTVLLLWVVRANRIRKVVNAQLRERQSLLEEKNRIIAENGTLLAQKNQQIEEKSQEVLQRNLRLKELYNDQHHMMGVVAHDLRAPLSKIRGLTDILGFNQEQTLENKEIIQRINDLTQSGNQLITDLTSLTVFEANGIDINWKPLVIQKLVEKIVQGHQKHASDKSIALHFQSSGGSYEAMTDKLLLTRMVDNLISNALKFSPAGKEVWVAVDGTTSSWEISVIDQGPGIDVEEQKKLFDKYSKLSARPTAGESSTGLGLSIVKLLVEHMGGKVTVESSLGEGSTFRLRFPKANGEFSMKSEQQSPADNSPQEISAG